ncbi:hypothetical protein QFC21_006522 [Naganishia friedmannii]|uniref:Uncharacterized protein n=1 Tax=Naganishia friedmannii TaxID=89922 RepID=A0ACC2V1I9_9TREE|nr:hypothetical protein QFC21_006522 [Naganishia friedmannii]
MRTVLDERYPQGLPEWCQTFLEGIQKLGLEDLQGEEKANVSKGEDAAEARNQRSPPGSPLSELSSLDYESNGEADAEQNIVVDEMMEEDAVEQTAESKFQRAILLSESKEALPFIWLAYTQMQLENWALARQTLQQAVKLEPWNTAILFRLSSCLEKERNYIEACNVMERALQLTPYDQRDPYRTHFARLSEQSDEMKANVFRGDPFDLLPLEVIINIMRMGATLDDNFLLKSTWVCQRWRNTLVNSCPELWQTLAISNADVKNGVANSRRLTWLARSNEHITALTLRDLNCTSAQKLPAAFKNQLKDLQHLTISATEHAVLSRISWKFAKYIGALQSLTITTARGTRASRRALYGISAEGAEDLCFGLVRTEFRDSLLAIEVQDMSFSKLSSWGNQLLDSNNYRIHPIRTGNETSYPKLKRLLLKRCAFDNAYDPLIFSIVNGRQLLEYQCDPLHAALRRSPDLESLEVDPKLRSVQAAWPGLAKRITLSKLTTAILPPPSLWSIDILAPNLKCLSFRAPHSFGSSSYDRLEESRQRPLIPTIEDSPVPLATLSNLENAEFVCYKHDTGAILQEWISRLSNVEILTIRSLGGHPWPGTSAASASPDERATCTVVQMLIDHPEWCPKLCNLQLDRCFAPGNSLVELVRVRNQSSVCVRLERLSLTSTLRLSTNALAVLRKELPRFCKGQVLVANIIQPKEYLKDNFEVDLE